MAQTGMVTDVPCELICVDMCPSAAAAQLTIYNGTDATGEVLHSIYAAVQLNTPFSPSKPIYCSKGIHVVFTANVTRAFVQYRHLPRT
jgi:hypothetical protein